ncbi:ABC transporter permease [Arthrobacter gengyunqii]|uniref:ABC transporter permease n=1 Tax=Arthrobacter gengyunqii TaxID=2886940 RepID=A0A9X1M204_9MICC|nr:ABC transporter permease [Arthrobacter gengyunqii]MCC3269450.1 ABC transporter permease [Arthrobacter gengyunqii]UOY97712.1 ABC transporter permease [Arthrobacter gengyunqii]
MFAFALSSIRHNRGGFAGAFIAVFLCAALITAMGVLIESGLRGGTAPQRLAGADVVVGAPQSLPVPENMDVPFAERVLLSADKVADIGSVPGVERAVGNVSIPLVTADGQQLEAAGWESALLAPYALTSGQAPRAADEVVLDGSFGAAPGSRIELFHGGEPSDYTVTGTAAVEQSAAGQGSAGQGAGSGGPAVFLSSSGAAALWPHGDTVTTVGVIADPGADPEELAAAIETQVGGVTGYTGDRRGDAESRGGAAGRTMLFLLSTSLAGTAVMTAVFVTAGTLSLSIAARRREFALLRAVGAGAGQTLGLIVREVVLVAGIAAVLGTLPGFWLAQLLGRQFTVGGIIPADFALAYSPLPALAAVLLSTAAAAGASVVAARGAVRATPTTALREAVTENHALGLRRTVTGLVLLGAGLAAALTPLAVPGLAGLTAAAGSALLLVIAAGVLGPWIVAGALKTLRPLLRRSTSASMVLAEANAAAFPRRMAAGIVPLALAVALGSVQLFMASTVETEAAQQSRDSVVADYLVSAPVSGISAELAERVGAVPGVRAATPVARSTVLARTTFLGLEDATETYAISGLGGQDLESTLNLGVSHGSLARLAEPGTVALSNDLARSTGTDLGGRFAFHYGDGTEATAVVVATYERGLGFGDLAVDNETLRQHTTAGLNDYVLVSAEPGADAGEVAAAVGALGLTVLDPGELGAAGASERSSESWISVVGLLVLLGYVGLSVANSLVMATARRRPELMLLRALGASDRQLRRMTGLEALAVVVTAVVLGSGIALLPLMGIAFNVSGQPFPTIVPGIFLALAGTVAALGLGSIAAATHAALRPVRE